MSKLFLNLLLLALLLVFISPIIIIVMSLFGDFSENIQHIFKYVLGDYITNSIILLVGVLILSGVIGIVSSWLVTNYNFFGKNFFEWALILPFAVPPYILAFTFTEFFESYGIIAMLLNSFFEDSDSINFFSIRNIFGAIFVLSFTLYPYVYLLTRISFLNQSKSILESAETLGLNLFQRFFRVSLPTIRPAIIAGLALISMETLSDFGAVEHFAVPTFTTGIFRTWQGMYDLQSAMQLSSILLFVIAIFFISERISRSRSAFTQEASNFKPITEKEIKGIKSFFAFLFCLTPVFIGFILPVSQLIFWGIEFNFDFFSEKFIDNASSTLFLGAIAAILCTSIALIVNISARYNKSKLISGLGSMLSIGYGLPGLILAVGVVKISSTLDSSILQNSSIYLTGSLTLLITAYLIKSYALASNSIESGLKGIDNNLDDASKTLQTSGLSMLFRIHFPLLSTSIFTSSILVFSEVVKELPATLILRPFNFDTLAVSAYIYAAEERMFEAAAPAISIVAIGLIPIYFMTKLINKSSFRNEETSA